MDKSENRFYREKQPENPSAFPQLSVESGQRDAHGDVIEPFTASQNGMTLRDYFAGKVLVGLVLKSVINSNNAQIARSCYAMADEMLKVRG